MLRGQRDERARGTGIRVDEHVGRNGCVIQDAGNFRGCIESPSVGVHLKNKRDNRSVFEVESRKGLVRGDLSRAVVEAGWDLNELRPAAVSLEEVFLQLTGDTAAAPAEEAAVAAGVK